MPPTHSAAARPLLLLTQGHAGDRLGARLLPALRERFPDHEIWGTGGEELQKGGVRLVARTDDISAMGWTGLPPILPRLLLALHQTVAAVQQTLPACVIAVDVWQPLQFIHRKAPQLADVPHVGYLPPGPNFTGSTRVHQRASSVFDVIATPFPHQERLYTEAGGTVVRAAHQGLRAMRQELTPVPAAEREPMLALLPGSRALEIRHSLDVQYEAARLVQERYPELVPVVCCASDEVVRAVRRRYPKLQTTRDTRSTLARARAAIICSGTAALEAAILGCPGVVTYHGSRLQRWEWHTFHVPKLAKLREAGIASPYVALPNIISGQPLYPEMLDVPAGPIAEALQSILADDSQALRTRLDEVANTLYWEDAGTVIADQAAELLAQRSNPAP